ncbi:RNA polymerase I-specific transcription initiation factor rrn3 [Nannizzia gypsea CBS 118893]|uniref:RNA polymerase I-specific transcription initiation factor rrn3 n=1 Tax=Arthroderma gypseum (strain ATCC MYA-4604 / CBS 118893) TaxID=535722 RepID=E4UPI8_ARTGP|nr:RNA polymerase I-specific transcription initiation factor RRN3 family protein [Nannizzia gypsea CBS 118893]EFQ99863.1 RNA polymerase I-specific transcription initiation factor rrn3 [Nannizzia gypsea CBS 118893]
MVSVTHLPSTPSSVSKPSKSILKPFSVAGQKRKLLDLTIPSDISTGSAYSDTNAGPTTATTPGGSPGPSKKRARVKFDITVGSPVSPVKMMDTEADERAAEKDKALTREEVRRAIQRHLVGDSEGYDRIKEMFSVDPKALEDDGTPVFDLPSPVSLKNHLMGLLGNVSSLDGSCSGLVHAMLNSEWVGRDTTYVRLFVQFLATLSAARGGYLSSVLKMLVNGLRQVDPRCGNLPDYDPVDSSEMYHRVHHAIRSIAQVVPACSVTLSPILSSSFPHDSDTVKSHITYTRNLIKIISYLPELRSDILALITEKLVKIDAQNQVNMEDLEEDTQQDIMDALNATDAAILEKDDDDYSDDESEISEDGDPDLQRVKSVKECMLKVDSLVDILFEYYNYPFVSGSLEDQEQVLDFLLAHFKSIILPTYRSRHAQFVLFHFAQASPIFVDRFAAICIEIILSKSQPVIIRQYAAAYLASFVARGAHVPGDAIRDVFNLLGSHALALLSSYEADCRGPDLRRYSPFYSTAQALFYIFCFRWKDLTNAAVEAEAEGNSLPHLNVDEVSFSQEMTNTLHRTIYSKLNPLKVCSPGIVSEFAKITHYFGLFYLYPKLESNKRIRIHNFRGMGSMAMDTTYGTIERETRADDSLAVQMDDYFPFDPYKMPRGSRHLQGDYIDYKDVRVAGLDDRGLDDDDDDDTASEDEDEDEDDVDRHTETEEE